jgi:hypothetical protein
LIQANVFSTDSYTVVQRVEDYYWKENGHEWGCKVYADLFLNGNPVQPSFDYFYEWWNNSTGTMVIHYSGYGQSVVTPDGPADESYLSKVVITGPNFSATSGLDTLGKYGTPIQVDMYAKRQSGTDLTGIYLKHYTNPNWRELDVPNIRNIWLSLEQNEYLWSKTDIITNPAEKYNHWNQNLEDVINYQGFSLDYNDEITAWYKTIGGATIQSVLISGGIGGDIQFKDPWYPNDNTLGGIAKNKGMNADWFTYQTILEIEPSNEDQFKGVFLYQGWPNWVPPYYLVNAPEPQTIPFHGQEIGWYFQWWSGTDVQFEHPFQAETPVVFEESDAVAQANFKGHLATNSTFSTAVNNGRRLIVDNQGDWHLVYEDNGQIYYTGSDDNGETWTPEMRLSISLSGVNSYPSIAHNRASGQIFVIWDRY